SSSGGTGKSPRGLGKFGSCAGKVRSIISLAMRAAPDPTCFAVALVIVSIPRSRDNIVVLEFASGCGDASGNAAVAEGGVDLLAVGEAEVEAVEHQRRRGGGSLRSHPDQALLEHIRGCNPSLVEQGRDQCG